MMIRFVLTACILCTALGLNPWLVNPRRQTTRLTKSTIQDCDGDDVQGWVGEYRRRPIIVYFDKDDEQFILAYSDRNWKDVAVFGDEEDSAYRCSPDLSELLAGKPCEGL